ncbi:hypothetical protein SBOR_1832 [Sclerotinia borealis F-4128]|uniref:Uncharacterized protein n=1 Tax=Sclerotinia borealis (strain F-4128) TaxID=1432307 RepID=W9CP80_SCLBF|nr:hypothetical protein SBOR_1832 [Sclerotinia borealis F-4128]
MSSSKSTLQVAFPGRNISNEICLNIIKYVDKSTIKNARLVSKSWAKLTMEYVFTDTGFTMSPFKDDMERLAKVVRTPMYKSIHHIEFNIGAADMADLGTWILDNAPPTNLKDLLSKEAFATWFQKKVTKLSDSYSSQCIGTYGGLQIDLLLLPLKMLDYISIISPNNKNKPSPDRILSYLSLLHGLQRDTDEVSMWAGIPELKLGALLDIISRLPSWPTALKNLHIDQFPLQSLSS